MEGQNDSLADPDAGGIFAQSLAEPAVGYTGRLVLYWHIWCPAGALSGGLRSVWLPVLEICQPDEEIGWDRKSGFAGKFPDRAASVYKTFPFSKAHGSYSGLIRAYIFISRIFPFLIA